MGRLSNGTVTLARGTHVSILRRQTAQGDSTLLVHWHDKDILRVWRYSYGTQGGFSGDTTHARLLSVPMQNDFCAGHASLHDGRLLVAGGTHPTVSSEIGTTMVSSFDPSQPGLWTSDTNWVVQDTMRHFRWYPVLTHLGDGSVVANSGLEYFEMPVTGGVSPQDSSGPFRQLRSLGLSPYPIWPVEPVNLDPLPATSFPRLADHTAIVTANQQPRRDGRGMIVTFGGISDGGTATSNTWQMWDVAVDAGNSWRSELMPLSSGSPLPPSRSQHGAGIVETATGLGSYELRMFVYGGLGSSGTPLSDVWLLTRANNTALATWQEITPSGPSPGPRYGHTAVFDPGVPPGGTVGFPPVGGLPRQYYPKLIVFGGKRSPSVWAGTDTVFVLQLWAPYTWHALVPTGQPPAPRYRHAAVMDRLKRIGLTRMRMSVFGGAGADGSPRNDTWTLSRSLTDTLYADWAWYQNPAGTEAPAVYKHSMVHDEQWDRLLVFGGDRTGEGSTAETNSGGETNEVFIRSLDVFGADSSWHQLATTDPIVRRSGHAGVYYSPKGVNARVPERFQPLAAEGERWSSLTASPKFDRLTYPFMFALPDGRLFYAGRNDSSAVLAASLAAPWGDYRLAGVTDTTVAGSSAVQYAPGKILKVGANLVRNQSVAARAEFSGGSHLWYAASNLNFLARGNPNVTMLPNGQVLVTGGRKMDGGLDGTNAAPAVQIPQIWTPPPADQWTFGANALEPDLAVRGYHSTAILLPDARVLSAGGEEGSGTGPDDAFYHGTIFEPPYLFDPNSSGGNGYATRPTIDAAPKLVGHGCPFELTVTASGGVSGVCLIRPGSVTHAFNQDQVYVPLAFTQEGGTVTVDGPVDANIAPPGDYMLFILDNTSRKVPSVARWVRVTESVGPYHAADTQRPGRILNLNGSSGLDGPGCSQPVGITWSAPSDDSGSAASGRVRVLDLRYSTSPICDSCLTAFAEADQVACEPPAGTPGATQSLQVHGLTIGSYQFRMVSQDDRSATTNLSLLSNVKTVSVFGCEEGFTGGSGGGGGGGFNARAAGTTSLSGKADHDGENSLLPAGSSESNDILELVTPRFVDGRLQAFLRRGATGETQVREIALIVADHPADREVFLVEGAWRLAHRHPARSVADRHGVNLTPLLAGDPESWLVGDTGDTLDVALPAAASSETTSDVLFVEAHAGRVRGVEQPGLEFLHRDPEGAWRPAATVLPRSRFSTSTVTGVAGDKVRVVFRGNHAIRSIGRLSLDGTPRIFRTAPASAVHSGLGAIEPTALSAEGNGTLLGPRERLDLAFDPPSADATEARTYLLEVTGTSVGSGATAARALPGDGAGSPAILQLGAPQPNPFSAGTWLRLGLPVPSVVRADVFDLAGRRVATVVRRRMDAGWHAVEWDGRSRAGGRVAAGIYLLRLTAGSRTFDRKLVVMP